MAKTQPSNLRSYLKTNGIKQVWLSSQLGMSRENLRYHLDQDELDPDVESRARAALLAQATQMAKDLRGKARRFA